MSSVTEPNIEGFYWATSKRRNRCKKRDYGQVGGLRWIIRIFETYPAGRLTLQVFGSSRLWELRDYCDYEGPLGNWKYVERL